MRALLWPLYALWAWDLPAGRNSEGAALASLLFAGSEWAHSAIVVAATTGECATLATDPSVGVRPASHCAGGHDRRVRRTGLVRSVGMGSNSNFGSGHDV